MYSVSICENTRRDHCHSERTPRFRTRTQSKCNWQRAH